MYKNRVPELARRRQLVSDLNVALCGECATQHTSHVEATTTIRTDNGGISNLTRYWGNTGHTSKKGTEELDFNKRGEVSVAGSVFCNVHRLTKNRTNLKNK